MRPASGRPRLQRDPEREERQAQVTDQNVHVRPPDRDTHAEVGHDTHQRQRR